MPRRVVSPLHAGLLVLALTPAGQGIGRITGDERSSRALSPSPPSGSPRSSVMQRARRNLVTVTAGDYTFEAPDTILAGYTTLRLVNRTDQMHTALIARLDEGRTAEEFVAAYGEAVRTGAPRPTWYSWRGGPGAEPHGESSTTQRLEPGQYVIVCVLTTADGVSHFAAGMVHEFVVHEDGDRTARQAAPSADLVVRLLEYAFDLSGPLTPGRHTIRVENAGTEPHDVLIVKLAPGSGPEELQEWMEDPRGPPGWSSAGGVAALSPGVEAFFDIEITAGDYLVLCLVDGPSGVPHFERGMIRQFRVTE